MENFLKTIKREFAELDTSEVQLRKFGLFVGGIILLIAALAALLLQREVHEYLPIAGLLLVGLGVAEPRLLKLPYYLWMGIAIVLGFFVGNLLLVLLFYVFLTPIAFLKRLFTRKEKVKPETYWIKRTYTWTKESMEQLF